MANLVSTLADKFIKLGTGTSYGDPVTVDGVEILPVAVGSFGFGAGDVADSAAQQGEGGGGGGISIPVGAYIKTREGLTFEPNVIALLTVVTPVIWVSGHVLVRVIRALKK